ncbi:MAG: hypothetical protein A4E26_00737 [Methanobacterium sp. PtaU1.Bin097]|nr:MAG: hypothetical protein A4E26_00737 [Methanobacterium sp. PtaU1.Bin097]
MSESKPLFIDGEFIPQWDKFQKLRDNRWTNIEIGKIKANWRNMDDDELSQLTGHPEPATTVKRCELGLYRIKKIGRRSMKRWGDKELRDLEFYWEKMNDKELARLLKRSPHSIKLKRIELGLLRGEWNGRKRT